MKKAIVALVVVLAVVGGGLALRQPTTAKISPEQLAFWEELTRDSGEEIMYFSNYNALAAYQGDKVALLLSGFSSPSPVVRYFAAYNSIEYMGTPAAKKLDRGLRLVNDDTVEEVKQAARFALSFYDGNYRFHPWVEASPTNTTYVYHRYHPARYNDGQVWQVLNGKPSVLYQAEGSIWSMHFSLEGKLLAVTYGGFNWGTTSIVDISSGVAMDVMPWSALEAQGVSLNHARSDPYVVFREWSGDSKQILFYYRYATPDYERLYGHGVYDLELGKVVRVTPPIPQTDEITLDRTELGWN